MKDNLIIVLTITTIFFFGTTIFNWVMWKDCYNYMHELEQELFNTQSKLYSCGGNKDE